MSFIELDVLEGVSLRPVPAEVTGKNAAETYPSDPGIYKGGNISGPELVLHTIGDPESVITISTRPESFIKVVTLSNGRLRRIHTRVGPHKTADLVSRSEDKSSDTGMELTHNPRKRLRRIPGVGVIRPASPFRHSKVNFEHGLLLQPVEPPTVEKLFGK